MLSIRAGYFSVFCEHPVAEVEAVCRNFVANPPTGNVEVGSEGKRFRLSDFLWSSHEGILTATMWRVREQNLPSIMKEDGSVGQVNNDLGESASFAYMPSRREALIQYNHHGPRHALLASFLSLMGVPDVITVMPVVGPDALSRMQNAALVRRIEYTLEDVGDVAPLLGAGVQAEVNSMRAVGGTTIRVEISMGRTPGGLRENAKELLRSLVSLASGVKSVKAAVRKTEEDSPQMLDLLNGRLLIDMNISESGREMDRAVCRDRLRLALRERRTTSEEVDDDDEPETGIASPADNA